MKLVRPGEFVIRVRLLKSKKQFFNYGYKFDITGKLRNPIFGNILISIYRLDLKRKFNRF